MNRMQTMEMSFSKPQKCALKVPSGRVLVNRRWGGSPLSKELDSSDCPINYSDGLGFVDFLPSDTCAVLYISEAELLTPRSFNDRVTLLVKEYGPLHGIIIVDECLSPEYQELLDVASIEHGITVFPVTNQNEIPRLLKALTNSETKQSSNPFKSSLTVEEAGLEKQQIALLKQIPNVGDEKAVMLLKSYGHVTAISKLSEERLSCKIGKADARKVYQYFRSKVSL